MRGLTLIGLLVAVITLGRPNAARGEDGLSSERQPSEPSLHSSMTRYLAALPVGSVDQQRFARVRTGFHRAPKPPGFIARHPVVSGLLIGMAAGTAVAAAGWGSEGAFVGFYSGAAVGATLGWALSR